ncbi:MarR family winged helix-turn-helix transcriptional regulator [Chitinophaga horti]|uniref:MarR family winged helix-turn-helix transcriptional regulator n=1 Tax=Chitinophaga horti TaxID=2920382 RepID=A0ABY6JBP5_9BACT|nr:helix-turn-helix domain-containing protein [Chitinophaga horti]UYQ95729.1 MarR family winged helix-turn-helix transcriptional regulator [Chitinophaga horti]
MSYQLVREVLSLIQNFESNLENGGYAHDVEGFKRWIAAEAGQPGHAAPEPGWEGKEQGRSAESVINTLILHMNRYAKTYSKSAIYDSPFSTQEEFIYLINLKAFGEMTKMELVKRNLHEKPTGMQIINRLIEQGWVSQAGSETDRRSKLIRVTDLGLQVLGNQMEKIRQATRIVTGDLSHPEKMELIRLLTRLNDFHYPIFHSNHDPANLLDAALQSYLSPNTPK